MPPRCGRRTAEIRLTGENPSTSFISRFHLLKRSDGLRVIGAIVHNDDLKVAYSLLGERCKEWREEFRQIEIGNINVDGGLTVFRRRILVWRFHLENPFIRRSIGTCLTVKI